MTKKANRPWYEAELENDSALSAEELAGEAELAKGNAEDFSSMLESSLSKKGGKRLNVGDKIRGEILVLGKEEVFVSTGRTGTLSDGVVSRRDLTAFETETKREPFKQGDTIELFVTMVKGNEVKLSPNPTSKNMADDIEGAFEQRATLTGVVAEVVNGGFRVQIKGKLAFCPISQMDTKRIETPEEYIGRKLDFHVTKFEEGGRNIVVSRRRLMEQEATASAGNFATEKKVGDIVRGRVARLEKFGAFVELAPGIDGLVHVSELAWSRVNDPAEAVQVGQEVSAKILKIETTSDPRGGTRMRVSLSIKQAGAEPWDNLPSELRAGQVVAGRVTRIAKFGAFVELTPGIEGLIPLSEMSYTKRVMSAEEVVREGEQIIVMIKDVDPQTKRVSLSLKDAGSDPWALVSQKFPVGSIHQGKVTRREAYGLFVQLEDGITGLFPKSKASEEFPFDKTKINDTITVQVAEIRQDERRISLQPPGDESANDWKGFVAQPAAQAGGGFGTLADKLKAAMNPAEPKKKK